MDSPAEAGAMLEPWGRRYAWSSAGIEKLLAKHVDDGTGHCRRCTLPGQRGFGSWPGIHHIAATLATEQLPIDQGRRESSLTSGP